MRFLFLLYDFYPNFGANSLIINNLAEAFIEKGHEVHLLPLNSYPASSKEELWKQLQIHRITQTFDKKQLLCFVRKGQLAEALKLFFALLKEKHNKKEYLALNWSYYSSKLFAAIIETYDIDAVINVCYPFESCLPVLHYLKKKPKNFIWAIYMQDPFATNYYYLYRYPMRDLLEFQAKAFQQADKVIVTSPIMKEFKTVNTGIQAEKLQILNFPKIERAYRTITEEDIIFDSRYINCVYVGRLNKDTRNPRYLFQLFEALKRDSIRLHILGEEQDNWSEYISDTSKSIFFYGTKSKEVSMNAELNANVLVNMGNSVSNQMPSKLLEYISTGKPIVNLYKIDNCPTLEIVEKYPVYLNIFENETDFDRSLRRLRYFCIKYRNFNIKYQFIKKIFYSSTVEYVSNEFLNLFYELRKDETKS